MATRSPFCCVIFNLKIVSHEVVDRVSIRSKDMKHERHIKAVIQTQRQGPSVSEMKARCVSITAAPTLRCDWAS